MSDDIAELIKVANMEYKMTYQEIADWVGVRKYMVCRWVNGRNKISAKNYEKVQDMIMRLSVCDVKYPRQAIDILRNWE